MISRLHDHFHIDLPVKVLFESPTVAGLVQQIEALEASGNGELERIDDLLTKVDQLSDLSDTDGDNPSLLDQIQNTTAELAELSAQKSLQI